MFTPMNDYDTRALKDIRAWQERRASRRLRNAIPESVRARAGELVDRGKEKTAEIVDDLPGSEQVKQALLTALEGSTRTVGAAAAASVRTSLVIRRYRRAGHLVERIEDIQDLDSPHRTGSSRTASGSRTSSAQRPKAVSPVR